jgi:hypothetical protein
MLGLRFAALVLAVSLGFLSSQRVEAQVVTPADTAAVLYEVATQLQAEGRHDLAQAMFELVLRRYPASAAAAEIRRRRVEEPRMVADRSGRVALIVGGTLYGLWLGIAVPLALEAESPEAYGLGMLVGGPAGFFAAKSYAERIRITAGHAEAINFGGAFGTWQGFGWREVTGLGTRRERLEFCQPSEHFDCHVEETSGAVVITAMIAGGLAGIVVGDLLARRYDPPHGLVSMSTLGTLWGTGYGFGLAALLEVDEDKQVLAMALLGGPAGLITTALLTPRTISVERARLINIAGVAGLVAGIGLDLILQPDNVQVAVGIPMATSAAGLYAGSVWTRDYDTRRERGQLPGEAGLLKVREGALSLGAPRIAPTTVPAEQGRRRPAIGLTLLDARF